MDERPDERRTRARRCRGRLWRNRRARRHLPRPAGGGLPRRPRTQWRWQDHPARDDHGRLRAARWRKSAAHLSRVLVKHHARPALEFADAAIVLERGAIVFSGTSRELLDAPERLDTLMGIAARASR